MKSKFKCLLLFIMIFIVACSKNTDLHLEHKKTFSEDKPKHTVNEEEDITNCSSNNTTVEYYNEKVYDRKDDENKLVIYFMDIYEISSQWGILP